MEKTVRVVVDRFEGDFAVCETDNREIINIGKSRLPENVREGDVLVISGDSIVIDSCETEKRRNEIVDMADGLWK